MAATTAQHGPAWAQAIARHRGLFAPIGFLLMIGVIVVPLPPVLMDVLLAANITLSALILLTVIYLREPLDFSVFPALLLAVTLLRLTLNIATTRLILSADASSAEEAAFAAGHVVQAFGNFVAGNSLVVGIILFVIIIVVQFVVITKGATRISEVAARFTLDAMPGKQMAIDADLNAGMINEQQARSRRERLSQEADFFGAMDGASKFVRGDAIAGIIITLINITGGFAIGAIQKGWGIAESADVFTRLTIGDGLASQLPALIVSVAAGLLVTRSGAGGVSLGDDLARQVVGRPISLFITAGFLATLSVTPLPMAPLLLSAAVLAGIGAVMRRNERAAKRSAEIAAKSEDSKAKPEGPKVETLLKVDTLELEVGYGLVPLVDTSQGGDLLERISAIRRQLAIEYGFVMPPVRIRDNMSLDPSIYRIKIRGASVAEGQTHPGRFLAIDSGLASGPIEGQETREPAFGLNAWWIDAASRPRAEALNYTVVDASSVLATHLTEVVRAHADELLTREEVNNLVAQLKEKSPKLVEEVVPAIIKPGELQKILQSLLRERVPIRDLETILETLADWRPKTQDPDVLVEYVRNALRRVICQQHAAPPEAPSGDFTGRLREAKPRIVCVTLDPAFEDLIAGYIDRSNGTAVTMPPKVANLTARRIIDALKPVTSAGHQPVVIASPQVRGVVRQIVEPHLPTIVVLGYNEIVPEVEVESLGLVAPPAEMQPASAA